MPKTKVIAKWTEVSQGCIESADAEVCLFVNHCEVHERKAGPLVVRRTSCEFLRGPTKDAAYEKVRQRLLHDDVRLLAKGLEANDFAQLPPEEPATPDLIDGKDDRYADKYAIGL